MPELPSAVRQRYASLGLSQYDALVLSDEPAVARYFDAVLAAGAPAKPAANWVQGDVMAHCKEARLAWEALPGVMAPAALAEMIQLIEDGTISGKIGKEVLPALLAGEGGNGGGLVRALVEARGLVQISDPAALAAIVDAVLAANPKQLEQYRGGERAPPLAAPLAVQQAALRALRPSELGGHGSVALGLTEQDEAGPWGTQGRVRCLFHPPVPVLCPPNPSCHPWAPLFTTPTSRAGKTKLQGFFVGAVMKESKGRANPAELNRILMERLNAPQ